MLIRFIIIISVFISGCGFQRELPQHLDKTVQENDEQGRLKKLHFQKWTSYNGKSDLATINQEFDSLGRLTREWGTDHQPYGPQYMLEFVYSDLDKVENRFRWDEGDSTAFRKNPKAFQEEKIIIDSAGYVKMITIDKIRSTDTSLVAFYYETYPVAEKKKTSNPISGIRRFYFELNWEQIIFNENGRIDLGSIRLLPVQW